MFSRTIIFFSLFRFIFVVKPGHVAVVIVVCVFPYSIQCYMHVRILEADAELASGTPLICRPPERTAACVWSCTIEFTARPTVS